MANLASVHGKTLVASLLLMLFGGSVVWRLQQSQNIVRIDIGVEHRSSFALELSIGGNANTRFLEIGNDGVDPVSITIPETWERREVRNVPLASILSDPPDLGYVRWKLPSGATVTYHAHEQWTELAVHNGSKVPFQIRLTKVDLETQTIEREVLLIKDAPVVIR